MNSRPKSPFRVEWLREKFPLIRFTDRNGENVYGLNESFCCIGRVYRIGQTRLELYGNPGVPPVAIISTSPERIALTKDRAEKMMRLLLEKTDFP